MVIAIVAILAAILLPSLAHGKESARGVICITNIRQFGLGSMVYANDYRSRLPNFRDWLCVKLGDLSTGKLYPYVGAKKSYLCPTDALEISSKKKILIPSLRGLGGPRGHLALRDYSYAMNCCLCHNEDIGGFVAPSQTLLFTEPLMATNDYSGQVGPTFGSKTLTIRHNKKGHYLMTDGHAERVGHAQSVALEKKKLFWFPTTKTLGPGGNDMSVGLQ